MAQEKRKPFKGKKPHKDLRDYKNQEIKRSLVHRARLRKSYFKLLEKEGVPAGQEHVDAALNQRDTITNITEKTGSGSSAETGSDSGSDNESDDEKANSDTESSTRKRHGAPLPPQKDVPKPREKPVRTAAPPRRKQLNFAERAQLARERKEQKREEELRRVQERRQKLEQSKLEREKKKLSLSQRTKRGQPVMGPKINDLLDKIRQNSWVLGADFWKKKGYL